jgi:hypothetical protein
MFHEETRIRNIRVSHYHVNRLTVKMRHSRILQNLYQIISFPRNKEKNDRPKGSIEPNLHLGPKFTVEPEKTEMKGSPVSAGSIFPAEESIAQRNVDALFNLPL